MSNEVLIKGNEVQESKILVSDSKPQLTSFSLFLYVVILLSLFVGTIIVCFGVRWGQEQARVLVNEFEMKKPLSDERKYRSIKLDNGIEAMLISDVNSPKAAASLSVGVGSFHDDEVLKGLAHYCEHMIFLGSKQYPQASTFEDYLSIHGGSTNAFTDNEKTTFYFEMESKGYSEAISMFSRMFAYPLFDKKLMEKEINAVNSENEKNLNDDSWRQNEILKVLSDEKHPYHHFSTGNTQTLKALGLDALHQKLLEYYDKFYIPTSMKLAVLSNASLDELQQLITTNFSDIRRNKNNLPSVYGKIDTTIPPYSSDNLGKVVWIEKKSLPETLDFIFLFDEILSKYETKPVDYISYIFKYAGEGSLLTNLKSKKFATNISTGVVTNTKHFTQFTISLTLTKLGVENVTKVIQIAQDYIKKVRDQPISEEIYNEIANISHIQFNFVEKNNEPGDYLSTMAGNMFDYPPKYLIEGDYLHSKYDQEMLASFVNKLTIENSLIFIGTDKYPKKEIIELYFLNATYKNEHWYGTKYLEKKITPELMTILKANSEELNFKMRPKNAYITQKSELIKCSKDDVTNNVCSKEMVAPIPVNSVNVENLKVWYKTDKTFLIPKVDVSINLINDMLRSNTQNFLSLTVFYNYFENELNIKSNDASDAGNDINSSFNDEGFNLKISSFSDVLSKILNDAFTLFFKTNINEATFNQMVELTRDNLSEYKNYAPYRKAKVLFDKIIKKGVIDQTEMLNSLSSLKFEDFSKALAEMRKTIKVVTLFYGDIAKDQVGEISNTIKTFLPYSVELAKDKTAKSFSDIVSDLNIHKSLQGSFVYRSANPLESELNNVILNLYQGGLKNEKTSLIMKLIKMTWGNSFYYQLRTLKQLGYIVWSEKIIKNHQLYFYFLVQGSKESPEKLDEDIDSVITLVRDEVKNLTEEKLKEFKRTIEESINKKDSNLSDRTDKIWEEIKQNTLDFTYLNRLKGVLDSINKSDLIELYDSVFISNPHKLSVQLYNPTSKIPSNTSEVYGLNRSLTTTVVKSLSFFDNKMIVKRRNSIKK